MNTLYEAILEFLNLFFPTAIQSTWGNLNELIAYLLSWGILYLAIFKPVISLFYRKKGK